MSVIHQKKIAFDPKDPAWGRKLWVRLNTPDGPKLFIIWPRIWKAIAVLILAAWLGLTGAAWAFVKYKRNIDAANFLDIAFYPVRKHHYRATLSDHYEALAQKQLEAGAWSKALVSLRLAVNNNPGNREARRQLAGIYRQMQRPDFAVKLLEEGLAHGEPDIAYLNELFGLLGATGRLTHSLTIGERLMADTSETTPEHREIVFQMAKANLALGRPEEAKALLEQWHLDQTLRGQLLLSEIEVASGYPQLALMRLENLARTSPNNEMVGLRLVIQYKNAGRLADARRVAFRRMINHPDSPGAHVDLISLIHESGDTDAFERECAQYLAKYSGDARALLLLASTSVRLKQPALARQINGIIPKDEQGYIPALFQIALMQAECAAGDYQAALKTADIVSNYPAISPMDQAAATDIRIRASYGLGLVNAGETWLNQMLTLSTPVLNQYAPTLARRLDELGHKTEARRVLLTLLDRNPDNPGHLATLVDYDLELQSWDEVRQRLPALLALAPPPVELLTKIWQLQDVLNLSPNDRQRLGNLLE